jgi:hypothetical protein
MENLIRTELEELGFQSSEDYLMELGQSWLGTNTIEGVEVECPTKE